MLVSRHFRPPFCRFFLTLSYIVSCRFSFTSSSTRCSKHRTCSKSDKHRGKCNSVLPINPFWKSSQFYNLSVSRGELKKQHEQQNERQREFEAAERNLESKRQAQEDYTRKLVEEAEKAGKC